MFLNKTLQLYLANSKAAIVFGALLVFVALFIQLSNVFASSGSMFFDYNLSGQGALMIVVDAVLLVVFLALYSAFSSIIVFSVRAEMSHVRLQFYLQEMLEKFALRLFTFYLVLVVALSLLGVALIAAGVNVFAINILFLLITVFLIFVPQAIVVDEKGLLKALYYNFEFIFSNFPAFVLVILLSAALLLIIPLIEIYFDSFNYIGSLVSIVIVLLFVVPFIETLKTQLYMLKFSMVKARHSFELKHKI